MFNVALQIWLTFQHFTSLVEFCSVTCVSENWHWQVAMQNSAFTGVRRYEGVIISGLCTKVWEMYGDFL